MIANGDVVDAESAAECIRATGAAGLMIGRGAIGRPTIFNEIKRDLGWEPDPHGEASDDAVARLWCWNRYLEICDEVYKGTQNKNLKRHAVSSPRTTRSLIDEVDLHKQVDQEILGGMVSEYLEKLAYPKEIAAS